jgi:16S rRNA C1402 N4-methylase RsmH
LYFRYHYLVIYHYITSSLSHNDVIIINLLSISSLNHLSISLFTYQSPINIIGGGGHTRAILERGGRVLGIDQDIDAVNKASELLDEYVKLGRLEIIQTNFRYIIESINNSKMLNSLHNTNNSNQLIDGVLMDLGIY